MEEIIITCTTCKKDLPEIAYERHSKGVRRKKCKECRNYRERKKVYNQKQASRISRKTYKEKKIKEGNIAPDELFMKRCYVRIAAAKRIYGKDNIINTHTIKRKTFWELWTKQKGKCAITKKSLYNNIENRFIYEIDHIIPFTEGGKHDKDNIRLLDPEVHRSLPKNRKGYAWEKVKDTQ